MPLTLEIVTPERIVLSEEGVESVTVPGADGELTLLPRHAALMTGLKPGPLTVRKGGVETDIALSGGFLEIKEDKVTILADTAERSDEIDSARVEEARERARALLREHQADVNIAAVMASLERAQARLRVIERQQRRRPGSRPPSQPQG
ncbi:MAG: F0F1 ATP synthase subunit epsilon [Dehalococcoidia bacterium]|nr:F0F1 ATP synthase subunit epsilon [Dehalococcoidia bacterium]